MEEIWKTLDSAPEYMVSDFGRVKSKNKIMTPSINSAGYALVCLWTNGKRANGYIHRLVAEAFVANPQKKNIVNHKNGNVSDNSIQNLEWVTRAENSSHAYTLKKETEFKELMFKLRNLSSEKRKIKCRKWLSEIEDET